MSFLRKLIGLTVLGICLIQPVSAQIEGDEILTDEPADSLPAFFSRIAFFQVSLGFSASGTGGVMEDQLLRAGFNRPGYNFSTGRTTPYPRTTGSGWIQFDAGVKVKDHLAVGVQFGTSNNQTAQGNVDTSEFTRIMALRLSNVYAIPYVRKTIGNGLLQYKVGAGIHRVQFSAPVTGAENRGFERATRVGLMLGGAVRLFNAGSATVCLATEVHLMSNIDAGPVRLQAGSAGNAQEVVFPRFSLPLSHVNFGLRIGFGQP
jgi:hypothetical protein